VLAQLADQTVPEGQIETPPETPAETFPEVLPEGLDLAAEFAEFAQAVQPPAKRNRLVNLTALLTAGLLLAAIFAVGLWFGLRGMHAPKPVPTAAPSPAPPRPVVASAPAPVQPLTPIPPPPTVPPFKVELAGVLPEVIPHGGFFPAGSTRVYWNVKLLAQSGEKPVELRTSDIVLRAGEWEYPCLGTPGGNEAPLPRLA
ncbi:MAG TPA: hypothetical protein DCX07_12530, partial [Phycisphaerales bacterium]|nr:hypothetical protein [Phycisphaerales bacterium]